MMDYQDQRPRLSIDTTIELREKLNQALPSGLRTQILNAVLEDLIYISQQPGGLHLLLDIAMKKKHFSDWIPFPVGE